MPASSSLPRRRLDPAQRRTELLEAGERVVRRMGTRARVEDVVRAAHAAKGTFYVYFETWDVFLLALREQAFLQLETRFDRFYRECDDWVEVIGGLPTLFIDMTLSLEGLHPALFHGTVARAPVSARRFNVIEAIGGLLERGQEQEALQAPDIAVSSRFIFSLLHEAADLVDAGGSRGRIAETLAALLLNALHVKPVNVSRKVTGDAG